VELEDDNTAVPRSHIDDEYAHAGETDPKVLVTTSRDPSSRLIQFAKVRAVQLKQQRMIDDGVQLMCVVQPHSKGCV
jgi:U3 small nucleolar ribonucleoprotein protein IMP4